MSDKGKIAFVFPGQGSQAVGMLQQATTVPVAFPKSADAPSVLGGMPYQSGGEECHSRPDWFSRNHREWLRACCSVHGEPRVANDALLALRGSLTQTRGPDAELATVWQWALRHRCAPP